MGRLIVPVPLPIAEVWAEMQAQVEELPASRAADPAGHSGKRSDASGGASTSAVPRAGCVRWGKQPGYVVFADNDSAGATAGTNARRPGSGTGSYGQLQQDGKLQRAVRERMVAGFFSGTIGERWRVFWKATGSEEQREPAVRGGQ